MYKAFNYRIYPNKEQRVLLEKHFGSYRYIYNWALNLKTKLYQTEQKHISCIDMINMLPKLKEELPWLKEVNSQILQDALMNLNDAYQRFFKKQNKFPKFKKKSNKQSYSFSQLWNKEVPSAFYIKGDKLHLMKFKSLIKIVIDRPLVGKMKSIIVKKHPSGKYFVSILCETEGDFPLKSKIEESTTIGIDLGIKTFATLSDGTKIDNPKYLNKSLKQLAKLQRRLSRKVNGSKNKEKARLKVAQCHEKITNQRNNFLHKFSTKLIRENQTICLEDLAVNNMLKNHKLAKAISDVSWSTFVSMLEYKANWYGKTIVRIGRFEPSSKMCSCGVINSNLKLSDRVWTCSSCNTTHDRDILAANNIKRFGLNSFRQG